MQLTELLEALERIRDKHGDVYVLVKEPGVLESLKAVEITSDDEEWFALLVPTFTPELRRCQ